MTSLKIRDAVPSDSEWIAPLFDYHARHGTASFALEGPSAEEWRDKMRELDSAPFLVAVRADEPLGYAYAGPFRGRPAYRHTCEDSIYLDPRATGQGIGTALLEALVDAARAAGSREMIAVIGDAEPASVALHRRCGFVERGRLVAVGNKFGRALDSLYMQRTL